MPAHAPPTGTQPLACSLLQRRSQNPICHFLRLPAGKTTPLFPTLFAGDPACEALSADTRPQTPCLMPLLSPIRAALSLTKTDLGWSPGSATS